MRAKEEKEETEKKTRQRAMVIALFCIHNQVKDENVMAFRYSFVFISMSFRITLSRTNDQPEAKQIDNEIQSTFGTVLLPLLVFLLPFRYSDVVCCCCRPFHSINKTKSKNGKWVI